MKRTTLIVKSILVSSFLLFSTGCGETLPEANPISPNQFGAQSNSPDSFDTALTEFSALAYGEQTALAETQQNMPLKKMLNEVENLPPAERAHEIKARCQKNPELLMGMQGMRPPKGGHDMQPGGPEGMDGMRPPKPDLTALAETYPELAAQLASLKDLEPEAHKAEMDAFFESHPELKEAFREFAPPRHKQHKGMRPPQEEGPEMPPEAMY